MIRTRAIGFVAALMAGGPHASAQTPEFDIAYSAGEPRPLAGGAAYYVEQGEGEPLVFFMQGFDQRYWQFQLPAFSGKYRTVALWTPVGALPPPGTAPSAPLREGGPALPGPLAVSLPPLLEALRAELGVEKLHLVTHSIGGRIALEAAAAWPDPFATLTLLEPAGGIGTLPPPEPSCTLEGIEPVEFEQCVFTNIFSGPGYYEALAAPIREFLVVNRRETNAFIASRPAADFTDDPSDRAAAAAMFFPICEEIGMLPMPLLFVRGDRTTAFLQSGLDHYERCLPEHETVVVEDAAHNAHIEAHDEFNLTVMTFIDTHAE
jgi:pimeloyl-ACP methyl ester carboxylesterase